MCGFAGFVEYGEVPANSDAIALLERMGNAIRHRGPDSNGHWVNASCDVGLVHQRLSIVDLSEAGHQPMVSDSQRHVLAFNGEIYNHQKIRFELDQQNPLRTWKGHSDTETLLAGFERWGVQATIDKAVGMFAFALWDEEKRELILGRDRFGEKPLYYGWQGDTFLFGSELSALKKHPSFLAELDKDALCVYLRHNYVPAPHSIYSGISKLETGTLATVSFDRREVSSSVYWSAADVARKGRTNQHQAGAETAADELEDLLLSAIGDQMMADVPLGAFLSGGIDSSAIVALMQAQSKRPVKTFSIGFHEQGYNEAEYAKSVAEHLGTDHTELYVSSEEAQSVIPQLPQIYDEPFADSSQIPTFLVSKMAREHVTVSLSGDGGDELFCGYNRYTMADRMWESFSRVPQWSRSLLAQGAQGVSNSTLEKISNFGPVAKRVSHFGDKLKKISEVMPSKSLDELYYGLVSFHKHPADWLLCGTEAQTKLTGMRPELKGFSGVERMMVLDAISYLPDDILVKVDRAAMAVSLETRVPFLDHRVFEFAWRLPLEVKLSNGVSKKPLRDVLAKHVPSTMFERPKMGFGVPLHQWLRGPLKEWADELLRPARLQAEGIFNTEPIQQMWQEHLSGQQDWSPRLWGILMFQAWFEQQ